MADPDPVFEHPKQVFDSAASEDQRYPAPSPGSPPGFYQYRRVVGEAVYYRWWNGEDFIGPLVTGETKVGYELLVALGVTPETFAVLSSMLGGGIDGLYLAIFVLLLYVSSGTSQAASSSAPSPSLAPSPSPSPGEASIALPPSYRFVWHFVGDTMGSFDGTLSGGPDVWHYRSSDVCFCWQPGHCRRDDGTKVGTATCRIRGAFESEVPSDIDCTVRWTLPDQPTWTSVNAQGWWYPVHDPGTGELLHHEFHGGGYLDDQDQYPEVTLDLVVRPRLEGCN
jgi:hypothetical protein